MNQILSTSKASDSRLDSARRTIERSPTEDIEAQLLDSNTHTN
jgi:hypothetical protein